MIDLSMYIDFESIIIDREGLSIEEGSVFMPYMKRRQQNWFCDQPVKQNLYLAYEKFINEVSRLKFIKRDYIYLLEAKGEKDSDKEFEEHYFETKNGKYLLYAFILPFCDTELIGLMDMTTTKYVVLGCRFSHPFVHTNDFSYNNSDGSGPEIITKVTPKNLITCLQKYYEGFCGANSFH